MNNRCAFAFPLTSFPKSSSESERVTVGQQVSQEFLGSGHLHGQDRVVNGGSCQLLFPKGGERGREEEITCRLISRTLSNRSLAPEIDVPALRLTGLILQGKGEDGISLLDGILALGIVSGEDTVDNVEGLGRGECSCRYGQQMMMIRLAAGGDGSYGS
jgi:hypothetical protein